MTVRRVIVRKHRTWKSTAALAYGRNSLRRSRLPGNSTAFPLLRWTLVLLFFVCHLRLLECSSWRERTESGESEENYYDASDEEDAEDEEDHANLGLHYGVLEQSHGGKESVEIEIEEHDEEEQHQDSHGSEGNAVDSTESDQNEEEDSNGHAELFAKHLSGLTNPIGTGKSKRTKQLLPPVTISVPYPVHIERKVPVFIETKVPVYVEKKVEVPVDRPYEVPVPVYEKKVIHVPQPVVYSVDRPYPVYVQRTVFVNKYQPFKVLIKSRTRY